MFSGGSSKLYLLIYQKPNNKQIRSGVAEFRDEKLEGGVGGERITVCCENDES
jgi:hypothetical protein